MWEVRERYSIFIPNVLGLAVIVNGLDLYYLSGLVMFPRKPLQNSFDICDKVSDI